MEKMNLQTALEYGQIFTAAWKLFKAFRDISTDEDWIRFCMAGEMIYKKYPCKIMMDLIWAVSEELERRYEKVKKEPRLDKPTLCYLCGKEISPGQESAYIKRKGRTEIWIHAKCINKKQ